MSPLISIIIPTYNRALLLKRAIESVQAQTYTNWELLVVDDGSTDETAQLVPALAQNDTRIRFFTIPHAGQPAQPRNEGLRHAQGTFIAFLDSDDTWHPEKLQKQLDCLADNPQAQFVSCYAHSINNATGKIIHTHNTLYRGTVIKELLINNFLLTTSTLMVRREVFDTIGVFDPQFSVTEDWDLAIRSAEAGHQFEYVPEPLVSYYIHESNIYMGNAAFDGTSEFLLLCTKHLSVLKKYTSPTLGYYYFLRKEYSLSRPYLFALIREPRIGIRARVKAGACIAISFCPWLLPIAQKSWRIMRRLLIHT